MDDGPDTSAATARPTGIEMDKEGATADVPSNAQLPTYCNSLDSLRKRRRELQIKNELQRTREIMNNKSGRISSKKNKKKC